jgi:hypothetical protein
MPCNCTSVDMHAWAPCSFDAPPWTNRQAQCSTSQVHPSNLLHVSRNKNDVGNPIISKNIALHFISFRHRATVGQSFEKGCVGASTISSRAHIITADSPWVLYV